MDTEALTVAYARVKAILDEAAGDSTADYGGAGRFWDNGAQALEAAEIFGIKMVAPIPEGHACCVPAHARSDSSGLIKGLRGETPFDGGRFPALPWGGHAVAPADIDRIADWIDAGCPDDATSVAVELAPGKPAKATTVQVSEIAEFPVAADGYSPAAGVGEPRRRARTLAMCAPDLRVAVIAPDKGGRRGEVLSPLLQPVLLRRGGAWNFFLISALSRHDRRYFLPTQTPDT